jgi:hypothetical protein
MSKFVITHSCGHTVSHQLFGPSKDRTRKAEWLETTLCTDCWKAEQMRKRTEQIAAENARSATLATEKHLPALTGTEKQVAWALSIRQQMVDSLEAFIAECGSRPDWAAKFTALREAFGAVVMSHTDARWFIDQRGFGTVRVAFGAQLVEWCKVNRPEVMKEAA